MLTHETNMKTYSTSDRGWSLPGDHFTPWSPAPASYKKDSSAVKSAQSTCHSLQTFHFGQLPKSCRVSKNSQLVNLWKPIDKGTGYSERPGKVTKKLCAKGTSKSSNELKSWPQPPCQLRLMKIYFLRHNISHLWLKIAIIWPFFSHFWPIFADF